MPHLLNKTLRLFLDGIGRREEYEFYLQRFLGADTPAFALLCPDADSVEEAGDVLIFDLQFLIRLDLVPIILLAGSEAETAVRSLQLLGDAVDIRGDPPDLAAWLQDCRQRGRIPVLTDPHEVVDALRRLTPHTARRVHWVRSRGGFLSADGELMPIVHTEKGPGPELDGDDAAVFEQARALLKSHPALHLSITSPLSLLEELFTVKGSGTVVRPGSVIETIASAEAVDTRRLGGLLEDAFGRPLKDPKGWRSADVIYLESEYRGAALVQRCEIGDYLAKFAVGAEARGLGLAQELWTEVTANHPRLYWRARRNNPIVPWYKQQADGRHLVEGWIIFWRGIPVADIVHVIADGLARPSDFVEDD